jgi:hypothetical protein
MGAFTEVAKASFGCSPQPNPHQTTPKPQNHSLHLNTSIPKLTPPLSCPTDPPNSRPNSLSPLPPPRPPRPALTPQTPRALQPIPAARNNILNLYHSARQILKFPDEARAASGAGCRWRRRGWLGRWRWGGRFRGFRRRGGREYGWV